MTRATWRGCVLVRCLDDLCVPRWVETDSKEEWEDLVYRSGDMACAFLTKNIIGQSRPVLFEDATSGKVDVQVRELGHYAKRHVAAWEAMFSADGPLPHPAVIRSQEKVLRHSVHYWTSIFPGNQNYLMIERLVRGWRGIEAAFEEHGDLLTDGKRAARICPACGDYETARRELRVPQTPKFQLCGACCASEPLLERARERFEGEFANIISAV